MNLKLMQTMAIRSNPTGGFFKKLIFRQVDEVLLFTDTGKRDKEHVYCDDNLKYHKSQIVTNKLQYDLLLYLRKTTNKSFTAEFIQANVEHFKTYTVRQIKLALRKLVKFDIGVHKSHQTINDYVYCDGFYFITEYH